VPKPEAVPEVALAVETGAAKQQRQN
jgi:hypothetical protein